MHALLLPIGSTGDVLPFVAVGRALRARGHDVTVGANPHFAGLIERAGLDFAAVGDADEYDAMCGSPKLMDRLHGFRFVMDFVSTLIRPIYELAAGLRSWSRIRSPMARASPKSGSACARRRSCCRRRSCARPTAG